MNGATTTFTMDLNTGLTQTLTDGTNTYLYGNGRISQYTTQAEYFLGDALNSVRQMTDVTGDVTLTQAYDPYGVVTYTDGDSQSAYGYTNEYTDPNGLVYLRARHYDPSTSRFLTRDPSRLEANLFLYTSANPINRVDPTGLFSKELIEKNLNMDKFFRYDNWTEHPQWGFYALLLEAQDLDTVKTGYVPITMDWNANRIIWSNPEIVHLINCEKIMIGSQLQPLDQYFTNVVQKDNEKLIHWRDTTAIFYELSRGSSRKSFLDGFSANMSTYPDFIGVSLGLWYGEMHVMIDMDGNRYLGISGGAGRMVGMSYIEGYVCDWTSGLPCAGSPSESEIEQAIAGLCFGGELVILTGINISPLCANLSNITDWSLSVSTYYLGLEAGAGGGVTWTIPLSVFGDPGKPDRGWRYLLDGRAQMGITDDIYFR